MKILIQGYNTCHQNVAGGVAQRIMSLMKALEEKGVKCKIYDYWHDKIDDYDLVHFFKVQSDHYMLAHYLKSRGMPYVVSSILPIEKKCWIRFNCWLGNVNIHTLASMNKVFMGNASCVLTESLQEKTYIEKAYGISRAKIQAIPNGVYFDEDTHVDKSLFLDKYHVRDGFVLCVGRIDANKNQLNLIKALNGTDIQLVIIGGPDSQSVGYFEECRRIAASNVVFTGWIPANDILLKSAYRCAKVVVLPSFSETFGNVVLEGAISHANISYSRTLAINEWGLNKYAYTFDPNSCETICKAIKEAYHSPAKAELYDFVQKHFTWDAIAQEHLKIYKQLL